MSKRHAPRAISSHVHERNLLRICTMMDRLLQLLEEDLKSCTSNSEFDTLPHANVWGGKESILSALVKLSQLQLRLAIQQPASGKDTHEDALTEQKRREYLELLTRFLEKRGKQNEKS